MTEPKLIATPEVLAFAEEVIRRINQRCDDSDWAYEQLIDEVLESAVKPPVDTQFLLQELSKRDRLIGRLEEFVQEYVPFNHRGRLDEILKAIAALYGDERNE